MDVISVCHTEFGPVFGDSNPGNQIPVRVNKGVQNQIGSDNTRMKADMKTGIPRV